MTRLNKTIFFLSFIRSKTRKSMDQSPLIELNNFNDFDRYSQFIKQANLECSQISKGVFKGSLTQVMTGNVMMSYHQMNQKIIQEGTGIKDYVTFLIPGNFEQGFIWRNIRFEGNTIGVLRENMEHFCVSQSNFKGIPVSIKLDYLIELSTDLGYPDFIDHLGREEYFNISEKSAKLLQFYVPYICRNQLLDEELIAYEIPKMIITSILKSEQQFKDVKFKANNRTFNRAKKLIHSEPEDCKSVKVLCQRLGVSERSLQYAFSELTGVSPKKYILYYKMNEIKRRIQSNQYNRLNDITLAFGFWHSGQFAKDYRNLFGKLPSQHLIKTLQT